jgi:hypothetical protein
MCSWFTSFGLALNSDKFEAILFATRQRCSSTADVSCVNVLTTSVALQYHIKLLGVTMDSNLPLNQHVTSVTKSATTTLVPSTKSDRTSRLTWQRATVLLVRSRLDYRAMPTLLLLAPKRLTSTDRNGFKTHVSRVVILPKRNDHVSQTLQELHCSYD